MAKVYAPPKEIGEVPTLDFIGVNGKARLDFDAYEKAGEEWVNKLKAWAKANGSSELAGEEIHFPVADGYARYIVLSLKPVKLIHVPLGDAWNFQYANLLTAKAIREDVARAKRISELFSRPVETPAAESR